MVRRGTPFDATVTLTNEIDRAVTVTRGALMTHLGKLRVSGPTTFSASASLAPAGAGGPVTLTVPLVMPHAASRSSFVTFALSFFGRIGTSARRQLLGTETCVVEATATRDSAVLTRIDVTPGTASVAKGRTQRFAARGTYSDRTIEEPLSGVTWSSDGAAATISASGVATGTAVGAAGIRASRGGVTSAAATLTVTPPVAIGLVVTPPALTLDAGDTLQLGASTSMTDGTTQDATATVTWSGGAGAIATVDAAGLVRAIDQGSTLIVATHPLGFVATATVTVSRPAGPAMFADLSPAQGSALGGTLVTISGGNFTPATTVTVGGSAASDVTFVSATLMTARTPPGAARSTADVTVANSLGGATLAGAFTYLFPFSIPGVLPLETGASAVLPVTLVEPAATPLALTLVNGDASVASVPPTATVPVGQRAIDVPVSALAEGASPVTVTIGGFTLGTGIFVSAPLRSSLELPAIEVFPALAGLVTSGAPQMFAIGVETAPTTPGALAMPSGTTHTVTLTLSEPAPSGGLFVSLSSNAPSVATVPPPVHVAAGQRTFSFDVSAVAGGAAGISAVAGADVFAFTVFVDGPAPMPTLILSRPTAVDVTPPLTIDAPPVAVDVMSPLTIDNPLFVPPVGACVNPASPSCATRQAGGP